MKRGGRIGHIYLLRSLGCIDLHGRNKSGIDTQGISQANTHIGIIHYLVRQLERAIYQDAVYLCQLLIRGIHTFQDRYPLSVMIAHQHIVLQHLTVTSHRRQGLYSTYLLCLWIKHLSFDRSNLQLCVKMTKKRGNQVVESIIN